MTFPNLSKEKLLSLDIETYDPNLKKLGVGVRRNDSYILGVAIATKDKEWYFPLNHIDTENNINNDNFYKWLKTLSNNDFVFANAMYDLDHLQYKDFNVSGKIFDVQFAEPLIDEHRRTYALDSLGEKYLGRGKEKTKIDIFCEENNLKGDARKHLYKMSSNLVGRYAKIDTRLTYDVFQKQVPILENQELMNVFNMECKLVPLLLQMKRVGVRVDNNRREELIIKYSRVIDEAQNRLNNKAGFEVNVYASRSLAMFFDNLGYDYPLTERTKAPSFTAQFLSHCDYKEAELILKIKKYKVAMNNFLDGSLKDYLVKNRVHADFNPLRSDEYGTVTGRFSACKPNLQQIPGRVPEIKKDIRGLLLPEEGYNWVKGDYSQVELRVLAHYARGEKADEIRNMYIKDPLTDFHQACADMIGVKRKLAKNINFGVVYGMGIPLLASTLGLSLDEGTDVIDNYHKKMPFLKKTQYDASAIMQRRGYVKTILCRRGKPKKYSEKEIIEYLGKWRRKPNPFRKALNKIIQGTAADVMKKAMVDSFDAGIFNTLIPHLTVHDEIDVSMPKTKEGEEAVKEMKYIFENTIKFKVPLILDLEIGPNWADLKDYEV